MRGHAWGGQNHARPRTHAPPFRGACACVVCGWPGKPSTRHARREPRPVTAGPRVLLLQLSQRTSAKGNAYLAGWLGKASVVAFQAEEPDKWGNPVWDVFVSTPEPRAEAGQERDPARRPQARRPEAEQERELRPRPEPTSRSAGTAAPGAPAKPSARPVARGDGWRGSSYRRPANGAGRAPAAEGGAFVEDGVDDLYR